MGAVISPRFPGIQGPMACLAAGVADLRLAKLGGSSCCVIGPFDCTVKYHVRVEIRMVANFKVAGIAMTCCIVDSTNLTYKVFNK